MILKDRRTPAERQTHTVLVGGYDSFMSSWGPCEGEGSSYCFWACEPDQEASVRAGIGERDEVTMMALEDILATLAGEAFEHVSIYVVRPGHRYHSEAGE